MAEPVVVATVTGDSGVVHVAIVQTPIDVARVIGLTGHEGAGAISVFLGTVRDLNDGRDVRGIDYEAYQPMAERELVAIAAETCDQVPGLRLAVEHRIGSLGVGDVSVAIAAAHAHRGPAMAASERVIEQLKRRVPIWKREHYVDGERSWVDPTTTRRADES